MNAYFILDWVIDSAEYVIVDREYEEVGREVLDEQDLSKDFDQVEAVEIPSKESEAVGVEKQIDAVIASVAPPPAPAPLPPVASVPVVVQLKAAVPKPPKALSVWREDTQIEEMLGLCYKSFPVGGVALFVPTPRGDYIAFHEGCPHYYLSDESIQAAKISDRNPPYVLGCIVFTETYQVSGVRLMAKYRPARLIMISRRTIRTL